MKPREVQTYSELAEAIWAEAEARFGRDEHTEAREWYEQTFCLSALGDALALARGWKLAGLEAISTRSFSVTPGCPIRFDSSRLVISGYHCMRSWQD